MSFGFSAGDFVTAATLAYKLVMALSDSSGASMEYQQLIQDLSCVHRTLLQVEKMKKANQLNHSTINALNHQVDGVKKPIEAFLERTGKYRKSLSAGNSSASAVKDSWRKIGWALHKGSDVKALRDVLQLRLLNINILLSTACYFVLSSAPNGQLGEVCVLEDNKSIPEPNWSTDLVVFEHINHHSGGRDCCDPAFCPRGHDARNFFRVGQVFMMLWDPGPGAVEIHRVMDVDVAKAEKRAVTNFRYSPYTGTTTIRRFLVVHEGVRSSYCLYNSLTSVKALVDVVGRSVSTLGLQGCSRQPDQENYGMIFTGSEPPPLLPGEAGMTKEPIRVITTHPSDVIPPQARIDYRRLCEVEHNVRCKDVGLVDVDSMTHLLAHLELCRVNVEENNGAAIGNAEASDNIG